MDDLAGLPDRPNHPGTTGSEHHNWCRRMPATADAILEGEPGASIISAIKDGRRAR
jgi:4-alpha-glucanotransferase